MASEEEKDLPGRHIHPIVCLHLIAVHGLGRLANHIPILEVTQKKGVYQGAFLVLLVLGQEGDQFPLKGCSDLLKGDLMLLGDTQPGSPYLQGVDLILEGDLRHVHVIDHHLH